VPRENPEMQALECRCRRSVSVMPGTCRGFGIFIRPATASRCRAPYRAELCSEARRADLRERR